ncbi:MAG: ROK family transcriptional regulator [Bacteroidales bacterium]|nr:ROK family transcriptional regulator [Bacteroidales bacterium]
MAKRDIHKVDSEEMNRINRRLILQQIRQKHSISRAELVKITGLAPPTVSRIVDRIVNKDRLARYVGVGNSNGGRPPVIVEFNSSEKYVLGIDLGATLIRGVLADLDAEIIMEVDLPSGKEEGYEAVIDNLVSVVNRLLSRRGIAPDSVIGLGIGVAGLLSKDKTIVHFSPDFGWTNVAFKKDLEAVISIPIFIENSTRLMALGEKGYGQGKDLDNFIVVNVGYGIAAGLVIGGQLVNGGNGFSGEFGHMTIEPDSSVICDCGRKGCLEALASGRSIGSYAREHLTKESLLNEMCHGKPARIDAKMVFEAYGANDHFAEQVCKQAIRSLSIGLTNLIHLLDPTHIFIGGGVAQNGDLFWRPLHKEVTSRMLATHKNVQISPAFFKEYATTIGSLALVLDSVLGLDLR